MTDAGFKAALAVVRRWEGGLVDHPSDPGGITKWGVSLRFLRGLGLDLNGDGVVDGQDIRGLTEVATERLYFEYFWYPSAANRLPPGLALAVFDCAVNQGPGRASRLLQKAVGAKVDGIIGPKTLAAVQSKPARKVLIEFMVRRSLHYSALRNFTVFGLGWTRRLWDVGLTAADQLEERGHD